MTITISKFLELFDVNKNNTNSSLFHCPDYWLMLERS